MSKILCHSLFWTLLFVNSAFAAAPSIKISKDLSDYFESSMKTCPNYKSLSSLTDEYHKCFLFEVEHSWEGPCVKGFRDAMTHLKCGEDFISQFEKRFVKENIELHRYNMQQAKKEIADFEKKGLSASLQINKYLNYLKNNKIEDEELKIDSAIAKLAESKKAQFEERKRTCPDIINLKEPLSLDRPRDQDTTGWCYAYTASDLLSHALGKEVSAAHVANMYNDKIINKILGIKNGGDTEWALDMMIEKGVCLEKDMPSSDYAFSKNGKKLKFIITTIRSLSRKYTQVNPAALPDKKVVKIKEFTKEQVKEDLCQADPDLLPGLKEIFPNLTIDQIAEILLRSGFSAFEEMAKSCPVSRDEDLRSLVVKHVSDNDKIFSTIDQQLEKGNIVGITYKAEVLQDYEASRGLFANHASSVVGRRFNEKTMSCEYLLRNSYGKDCLAYSKDIECKNGHAWVAEEFFNYNKTIHSVDYVEKK